MTEYDDLIKAIDRAHLLNQKEAIEIEILRKDLKIAEQKGQDKILSEVEARFEELVKSPEIDELIEKKIKDFLSTSHGTILRAMGFGIKYIKPIIVPIFSDIGPELAELYKKTYK